VGQHELAHRLPGNANNIGQGGTNCFLGAFRLAGEFQRQATRLPHTGKGVITTGGAQSFHE